MQPCFFAYALYTHRRVLFDPTGLRDARGRPYAPLHKTSKKIGFLYTTYSPRYYWYELVEVGRKLFFTLVLGFVTPLFPLQLLLGAFASVAFAVTSAYIRPYRTNIDQLNASLADLAIFFALLGALVLYVGGFYPPEQSSDVELDSIMLLTTIAPVLVTMISVVIGAQATERFVRELRSKIITWRYGMFGPDVSMIDVVLDHVRCRRGTPVRPVRPMVASSIAVPLQKMNRMISRVMQSEERLQLLQRYTHLLVSFCDATRANQGVRWHVATGPKTTRLDATETRSIANALLRHMKAYMMSIDASFDASGDVEPLNASRAEIKRAHELLTAACEGHAGFGRKIDLRLDRVDERPTARALYEMYQKLKECLSMLRRLPAYRDAVRRARTQRPALALRPLDGSRVSSSSAANRLEVNERTTETGEKEDESDDDQGASVRPPETS